jgi:hypothetical protein
MEVKQLIAFLNALSVGQIDSIEGKLSEASSACQDLGQPELADLLVDAREALDVLDLKRYRKRVHHVLSRLGHIA